MGNYIAQSDLDRLVDDTVLKQLTDDSGAGSIDTAKVTECIVEAEGEVDFWLARKYTVPITTTVPECVKGWSVALCVLRLFERRGQSIPEKIKDAAAEARRQLELVAKGEASLPTPDTGVEAPAEQSGLEPEFQYNERAFSRTTFAGW